MKRAFTLIELMVVIALIAIVSAVMVGEMSGTLQDAVLRSCARRLVNTFNLASSRAIAHNSRLRVRFDAHNGRYVIEARRQGRFAPLKEDAGTSGNIDARLHFEVRDEDPETPLLQSISFYPDGTADGREVILRDRSGFGLALRVNPITARVDVVELERK